jgi:UDP-N-acetylglucosamine--N-acetylmuramyl-(pentapeptide) pyrophosphoryl-undecaprenol N-acetylglucosamine transferase
MDLVYAAADVIVSRAGASSVSELCLVGKPVIFIPSPNVAEDHQTKNANAIVEKKGAILLKEYELDEKFQSTFSNLISNEKLQNELGTQIKKLAKPNATKEIVNEIINLIKMIKS